MTKLEPGQRNADPYTTVSEVMTPAQAADFLRVTTETLFRWRKDGSGPRYSQPNSRIVRYLRDDLITFLKEYRA